MNELETFETCDGKYRLTTKGTFLRSCYKPREFDMYDLITKYQLPTYLHNPTGPAIVHLGSGHVEYWLNGKKLSDEEGAKISHDYKFNNKLMDGLDETS